MCKKCHRDNFYAAFIFHSLALPNDCKQEMEDILTMVVRGINGCFRK